VQRQTADYWLALSLIEGLGPVGVNRLLAAVGQVEELFFLPAAELQQMGRLRPETAARLAAFADWEAVTAIKKRLAALGVDLLVRDDERYPQNLLNIFDPPPILYGKGRLEVLAAPAIAIVGSRKASKRGCQFAFSLARDLAERGVVLVSGMALGIDAAAHAGCLHAGGRTIAVWGSGLDVCYPARHRELAARIADSGLLLSEFPLGTRPEKQNFPRRNRLISGLAAGVVVVEASLKSGSLITARCALEQGREVFAVPGLPASPESGGNNWLLKEGAQLVESADDIFACLPDLAGGEAAVPVIADFTGEPPAVWTEEQKLLVELMGSAAYDMDELLGMTGWSHDRLSRVLLELEISGGVWRTGGGRFQASLPAVR